MTDQRGSVDDRAIRPGGLRRLRQGDRQKPTSDATVMTRSQFRSTLESGVTAAAEADMTVLVLRAAIKPLPDGGDEGLRGRDLPEELVVRVKDCHPKIKLMVVSPNELMLFVPELGRRPDGEELMHAVSETLQPPLTIDGLPHYLQPTIGGAMLDVECPTPDLLVDGALLALDDGRESSQATTLFHPYQRVRAQRREDLKRDLRAAVLDHQIGVALQPAFDIASGELIAFEAFARWERPGKGPVPAIEFAPLAAEVGVGYLLARQVLAGAIAMVEQLVGDGAIAADNRLPTLWLNVTPEDILHPELASDLGHIASSASSIPIGLELRPVPPAVDRTIYPTLKSLVGRGVRAAVADFGIGNANMTVLAQLPFDSVKLDRALIRQIAGNEMAASLVGALVTAAKAAGLDCTAQGVETAEQLEVLAALGCNNAQGYFLAEPSQSADELARSVGRAVTT